MGLFRNPPMAFQRLLPLALILVMPLLAGCNQTAAPEAAPVTSGVSAARPPVFPDRAPSLQSWMCSKPVPSTA